MKKQSEQSEQLERRRIAPDPEEPITRLAQAEALLAAMPNRASQGADAVKAAQDELQPYVERAEEAARKLAAVMKDSDNERLLRVAFQIDFDAFRRRFGPDPEGVRERDRVHTERIVKELSTLYYQTRDRLHAISKRVTELTAADLTPVQFDGEEWNGDVAGRYPIEPSRIKRHTLQLVKAVAHLPARFEELGHVLARFNATVEKYKDAPVPRVTIVTPEEQAIRAEGRPVQTKADSAASGYSN